PFTEYTPDLAITRIIGRLIPNLAGYRFSVNEKHGHAHFPTPDSLVSCSPLICYEAAFSNMKPVSPNHPSILVLLMNEGWYDSKKVASQFMYFAAARAIEQRRAVVRSSNAGISGIINQKGEVTHISSGWGSQIISAVVRANQQSTPFTEYAPMLIFLPLLLIIIIFIVIISTKK
ncbi:MAG: nitrilase-related carbon-nitrogen hydrolase, partial [Bacteroidales bacterium]